MSENTQTNAATSAREELPRSAWLSPDGTETIVTFIRHPALPGPD
jgi:hypothetical protein